MEKVEVGETYRFVNFGKVVFVTVWKRADGGVSRVEIGDKTLLYPEIVALKKLLEEIEL